MEGKAPYRLLIKTQKMGKDVLGRGRRARTEGIKKMAVWYYWGLGCLVGFGEIETRDQIMEGLNIILVLGALFQQQGGDSCRVLQRVLPDHPGRNIEDQVDVRRPVQTRGDAA